MRGKKKERFRCVSIAHVYVCAHSNRNVVFLLSQVSHRGRKIGVNSIEKWENSGKSKKKQRGKMCFSLWFRVLLGRLSHPFVKFPSATTHNNIENNDLARSLWHLWQQKDKTLCTARVRVRARCMDWSIFTISNPSLSARKVWLLDLPIILLGLRLLPYFFENKPLFCAKWAVVFWKQAVVLCKVSRHFLKTSRCFV